MSSFHFFTASSELLYKCRFFCVHRYSFLLGLIPWNRIARHIDWYLKRPDHLSSTLFHILGLSVFLCHLTKMCSFSIYKTSSYLCLCWFKLIESFMTTQFLEKFQTEIERIVQYLPISFNLTHQSLTFCHICFIRL